MKIMFFDKKMKIPKIIPQVSRTTQDMRTGPETVATAFCGHPCASERLAKTVGYPGRQMRVQHGYYKTR